MADRDVSILLKARDEASAAFGSAGRSARQFKFEVTGVGETLRSVGRLFIGASSIAGGLNLTRAAFAAARGDTDAFFESIQRLPFGLGALSTALIDLESDLMGVTKELAALEGRRREAILNASKAEIEITKQRRVQAELQKEQERAHVLGAGGDAFGRTGRESWIALEAARREFQQSRQSPADRELFQQRAGNIREAFAQTAAEFERTRTESESAAAEDFANLRRQLSHDADRQRSELNRGIIQERLDALGSEAETLRARGDLGLRGAGAALESRFLRGGATADPANQMLAVQRQDLRVNEEQQRTLRDILDQMRNGTFVNVSDLN